MFIFLCFLRLQFWFDLPMARFSATCQRNRICIRFLSLFVAILASRIGSCYVIGSQNNRIIFIVTEGMQGSRGASTSSGKTGQIRPQLPRTTFSVSFATSVNSSSIILFAAAAVVVITVVVHAIAMAWSWSWCGWLKFASVKVSTIVGRRRSTGWRIGWKPGGRGQGTGTIDFCRRGMRSLKIKVEVFIVSLWKRWTPA